ncbi:adenylyltransferase/cytidyltransferase family protein [Methylobacterium sp. V23]|uniref:adenylyltransferase/cytidyltransferase family protein n=1 Tax=Methylobacterium sp. V23 TaxID=2044878 RepID=UPI000CDA37D6|nr:adenylyltransferase/cytidyltransferase family protein [Methylobacterium sp. V23]POR40308.1 glycerol-3-phosphate cytidiltransferase [Methylobacterium sp. V23]
MTVVLTYGTYDLFHVGHLNLLRRLKQMGDKLVVGVSTDEFNLRKGKKSIINFEDRSAIVASIKYVDLVIPEEDWAQKRSDIVKHGVHKFVMGDDWTGKFDDLGDLCEVAYLDRTQGVSSSEIKQALAVFSRERLDELVKAINTVGAIAKTLNT